jgi:hypothetical protein
MQQGGELRSGISNWLSLVTPYSGRDSFPFIIINLYIFMTLFKSLASLGTIHSLHNLFGAFGHKTSYTFLFVMVRFNM